MQTINLKQYYPFCKEDIFVEVSDEIVEAFLLDKRAEAARDRKMFRYKAFYSLDCNDGIENAAIGWAQPSPEDYLIEKEELAEYEELIRRLYEAISFLPPMQARRVHARYMLGTAFWRTSVKCVAFHDILLHTEKPPYRFPHTAADCLFAEQVAVCAGAGQRQHQHIVLYAVDKQPVRENVTFPMACPIAGQVMVTVLIRQRFAHRQQRYDLLQQLNLQATLDGSFVVLFETGRVLDGIFGFFHLFRSANNSSRSL